ncbi:MAG: 16S rRNA (cytosine(967)-C(5))-methyltransferase RsmB [Solirubrobacterales bacterium]
MTVTASRRCAFAVVRRVFEHEAYADRAFRAEAERAGLAGRDRAFAMRLAYGAVQRKLTLDFLIERLSERSPSKLDPAVTAALRLGIYQIAFMERVPDHAAVGESVELAKQSGTRGIGLVNAVLRRAAREARGTVASLSDETPAEAALRHSHPEWIARLWWEVLGSQEARALMERDNEPAESAVRANTLVTDAASLSEALSTAGVTCHVVADLPEALVVDGPFDAHGSVQYARGELMPQSRASMLVTRVLDPKPGERVLDLCAAPGAKTTHIGALMNSEGEIVAVEANRDRASSTTENCRRLGIESVRVLVGDASEPTFGDRYDRVLVDPPCSDLGTLQSRPDARWRKSTDQVTDLAALQARMLEAGAAALGQGGVLVYSTCTIDPEENERQIDSFLGRHRTFAALDLSERAPGLVSANNRRFLQTLPHRDGTEGFFIAALRRES